jgi:enamine deaminase RidA (YjgF/YER057c/UK114 family)
MGERPDDGLAPYKPYEFTPEEMLQARNITVMFGWTLMAWNKSESLMRGIAQNLVSCGHWEAGSRAKLIIVELGSRSLANALNCITLDMPDQPELTKLVRHAVKMYETMLDYRNYLVHGLYDISKYGILPDAPDYLARPFSDSMRAGPFAYIIGQSARSEAKLVLDFFTERQMRDIMQKFEALHGFLEELSAYVSISVQLKRRRVLRKLRRKPPQPPPLPPMPKTLVKRSYGRREGIGRGAPVPGETQA